MAKINIGEQLKKARQAKGTTLDEVYQKIRIHPNVLSALEENNFDKILNATYIRSFIKEYSRYLGLDAGSIIAEYEKISAKEKIAPARPPSTKERILPYVARKKILKKSKHFAKPILAAVILLILIRGMGVMLNRAPKRVKVDIPKKIQVSKVVKKKPVVANKEEDIKQKTAVRREPVKVEKSQKKKTLPIPAGEKLFLSITAASDDVWIQLKVDGKVIFQNVLQKGTSETWQADKSFTIWTGKAESTALSLNGNDFGILGDGVMRNVLITREGMKRS